jgi:hypothetical protein
MVRIEPSRRVARELLDQLREEARDADVVPLRTGKTRRRARKRGLAPPSRRRYEASHPILSLRVPTELKGKIEEAARAGGISYSRWLLDRIAGTVSAHETGVKLGVSKARAANAAALLANREQGRLEGLTLGRSEKHLAHEAAMLASRQEGRLEGFERGREVGFAFGLLVTAFKQRTASSWNNLDLKPLARALQGQPNLAAEVRSLLVTFASSQPAGPDRPNLIELFNAVIQYGRYVSPEELRNASLFGRSISP